MTDGDLKVTYTAKELLARIDTKLDSIDGKLESKVDRREFDELQKKHDALEDRVNAKFVVLDEREKARRNLISRREALIGLACAVFMLLIQVTALYFTNKGHL